MDAGFVDTGFVDAGEDAPMDAGDDAPFDGGPPPPPGCPDPDGDTVFLFDFDSDTDRASAIEGELVEPASLASGDSPCGGGTLQTAGSPGRFRVPNRPAFDLASGSMDLWVKPGAPSTRTGALIGRDETDRDSPGQFSLFIENNRLILRMQDPVTTPRDLIYCSPPLREGEWARVGVNFGGSVSLYVNGELQTDRDVLLFTNPHFCESSSMPRSIRGNTNPFVMGASMHMSMPGTDEPIGFASDDLEIDHVRLSSVQRDYTAEL